MVAVEHPQPTPRNADAPKPKTVIQRRGLGFLWALPHIGISLSVDYLRERSDELSGEITVESTLPGFPAHLHQARLNLSSGVSRSQLAKHLLTVTGKERINWPQLIEAFCVGVLRKAREGEPVVMVGRKPGKLHQHDLIERLLPFGKPTMWYGPQGSGKGWMATAACVCVAAGVPLAGLNVRQGVPLYLDWEDSEDTLNERVQVVAAGMGLTEAPEIAYRKCRKTIIRDLHAITEHAQAVGASLIVVDSVGLAAGAAGDRGSYEDVALGLFEALRLLEPITILLIDHVSGEAIKGKEVVGKAFGSIYKMAEARCAWEIRAEQEAGEDWSTVGFYHTKHNHSVKYPAMGFRLSFAQSDPGEMPAWMRIDQDTLSNTAQLSKNKTLAERIEMALEAGPRSVQELATDLGKGETEIRVTLNRGSGTRFNKLFDNRWGRYSPRENV